MKPTRFVLSAIAAALAGYACGAQAPGATVTPTAPVPPAPTPAPITLSGTWNGTGNDSQGATQVTWTLTQSGDTLAGTVRTQAIDPNDGSCGSCHRNKRGTFTGTISGSTVNLTMFFAAGASGDPTPICSATLTGSATSLGIDQLATTYSGSDTCEGAFQNGTLAMTRQAAISKPQ